jgi:hypothetical protein
VCVYLSICLTLHCSPRSPTRAHGERNNELIQAGVPLERTPPASPRSPPGFSRAWVCACLVLPCLIHASCWAGAPRWGGRLRCWLASPLPLPQTWTCCAVQIADRHPSSPFALSGSPFALSGSSVGQRGIFAQTTQLLVPAKQTCVRCYFPFQGDSPEPRSAFRGGGSAAARQRDSPVLTLPFNLPRCVPEVQVQRHGRLKELPVLQDTRHSNQHVSQLVGCLPRACQKLGPQARAHLLGDAAQDEDAGGPDTKTLQSAWCAYFKPRPVGRAALRPPGS